jgi:acyl-CoA reductase-like NAD-dependent aldehyde dehydrogenase
MIEEFKSRRVGDANDPDTTLAPLASRNAAEMLQ